MIPYAALPSVNASLNGASALLLLGGFACIRRRKIAAHRALMLSALTASVLFLVSYVVYHAHAGVHRYPGAGWRRVVYLSILTSHTTLAIVIVPLVLRTVFLALSRRYGEHRRIARWTFPLWLYVSVSGVVVYEMLYR